MHKFYHFESAYGRGGYEIDEHGVVVRAAPCIKRFVGKRVERLEAWIKLYKHKIEEIPSDKEITLIR